MPWGKIYQLYVPNSDDCYVGSTCQLANKRLDEHIMMAQKSSNQKSMWIKNNSINICVLQVVEFKTKQELLERERYWIEKLKPNMNTIQRPTRTSEEKRGKEKVECSICHTLMNKSSLSRHINRLH